MLLVRGAVRSLRERAKRRRVIAEMLARATAGRGVAIAYTVTPDDGADAGNHYSASFWLRTIRGADCIARRGGQRCLECNEPLELFAGPTNVAGQRDNATAGDQRIEHRGGLVVVAKGKRRQDQRPKPGWLKLGVWVLHRDRRRRLADPQISDGAEAGATRDEALCKTDGGRAGRLSRPHATVVVEGDPQS